MCGKHYLRSDEVEIDCSIMTMSLLSWLYLCQNSAQYWQYYCHAPTIHPPHPVPHDFISSTGTQLTLKGRTFHDIRKIHEQLQATL